MRAGGGMLAGEGFLEDEAGEPVRGAVVTVRETGASVRTNDVGQYTIPLPYETSSLLAHDATGLVARSEPYSPPRPQGLTPVPPMVMVRGAGLRGVLRNPDGDPLPGAALVLEGDGVRRRTEAGENGLFAISGLLSGEYELTVLPFRGWLGFRFPVRVAGEDVDLQDLALLPVRRLRIQVVGQRGEPQANAHVVAEEAGLRRVHAQADELGWVTLVGLAGDDLQFEVRSAVEFRLLPVVRWDGGQLIVVAD